jgi:hypothetical protein
MEEEWQPSPSGNVLRAWQAANYRRCRRCAEGSVVSEGVPGVWESRFGVSGIAIVVRNSSPRIANRLSTAWFRPPERGRNLCVAEALTAAKSSTEVEHLERKILVRQTLDAYRHFHAWPAHLSAGHITGEFLAH